MDAKDWILLFVTVFVGALFSVIISHFSIYLTNKKRKNQNILVRRLEFTISYIEAIRKQVIDARCQLTENFEETLLAGKPMKTDEKEFAVHYRMTEELCNEILSLYNTTLVELK